MKRKGFLALLLVVTMAIAVACGNTDGGSHSSSKHSAAKNSSSSSSSDWLSDEELAKASEPKSSFSIDSLGFDNGSSSDYSYEYEDFEGDGELYSEGSSTDTQAYDFERKLVFNSSLSIETKKYDEDVAAVKELVASNGGYFDNTNMSGSAELGNRNASFTARIPADKYDGFMNGLGEIGSVTYKSENVDDITSNYVDVQARLKSLNTKRQRLEELEQKADTVEDLLDIEDRISDVQYQIESNTAQLKLYDKQVEYSTVNIDIDEVVTFTEVKADTAWNRFTEAVKNSARDFLIFLENFVVVVIYLLPYLIIIGIILIVVSKIRARKGKGKLFAKKPKVKQEKPAEESADKQA